MYLPADLRDSLKALNLEPPPDRTPELDNWLLGLRESSPEAYQMVLTHGTYAGPEMATEAAERKARRQSALKGVFRRHLYKKTSVGQGAPNRKLMTVLGIVAVTGFLALLALATPAPEPEQAGPPPEQEAARQQPAATATPPPDPQLPPVAAGLQQPGPAAAAAQPAPLGLPPIGTGPLPAVDPGAMAFPLSPAMGPGQMGPMAPPQQAIAGQAPAATPAPPAMGVYRRQGDGGAQAAGMGMFVRPLAAGERENQRENPQEGLGVYRPGRASPPGGGAGAAASPETGAQTAQAPEAVRRLVPGTRVDARLMTGAVVQEGQSVPAVVESEGLVWVGNATFAAGRMQIALDRVVAGGAVHAVQAFVLEAGTQVPGLAAQVTTTSPDAAQVLMAGAMRGLADYMGALARQGQEVITTGQWAVIRQGQAGPWWTYLVGALAGNVPALSPPVAQERPVRIAKVGAGQRVTVLVLATGAPR